MGKVGAGKSTIFKLLLREADNYDGAIEFGGDNKKDYSLDALLELIGYVPQDNCFLLTTVADNIRLLAFEKGQPEVEKAAKESAVHDDS